MNAPTIIFGEPNGVLKLPKAGLRKPTDWTQMDSDILAHLMQIQSQIHRSRWNNSELRFSVQGDELLDHSFPEFEDFIFAAVYIRQLIAKQDRLFEDAVTRYCRSVDCQIRSVWVQYELTEFNSVLEQPAFRLLDCTGRQLFDAFMYGAGLLHKIPRVGDDKRQLFLKIYDEKPRHIVLWSLNMTLKRLMNHVGNATVVMIRDYKHWLCDYGLPAPDTRWHYKLFDIKPKA